MNGFTFQDLLSTMRYTFGDLATQSIHMGSIALNLVLPLALIGKLPEALAKACIRRSGALTTGIRAGYRDVIEEVHARKVEDDSEPNVDGSESGYDDDNIPPVPEPNLYQTTWQCVGASVAGTRHADVHEPCQDWHRYAGLPNGGMVLAVADGVGSARNSDIGAELACDTAMVYLVHEYSLEFERNNADHGLFMSDVFQFAQDAVMDVAEETDMSPAEYATTLIVVVLTPDALVAAMIGDGMVIIEDESGEYSCLFDLPKHEYANQVTPITSQRCQDELQVKIVDTTSSISVHYH